MLACLILWGGREGKEVEKLRCSFFPSSYNTYSSTSHFHLVISISWILFGGSINDSSGCHKHYLIWLGQSVYVPTMQLHSIVTRTAYWLWRRLHCVVAWSSLIGWTQCSAAPWDPWVQWQGWEDESPNSDCYCTSLADQCVLSSYLYHDKHLSHTHALLCFKAEWQNGLFSFVWELLRSL